MSEAIEAQSKPTIGIRIKWKLDSARWFFVNKATSFALAIIRWASSDSNCKSHARREFKALGYTPLDQKQDDDPNKWIQQNVMDLLSVFATQGHSGSSAPYCVSYFKKLASFEPLSPITCEDSEWNDTSGMGGGTYQNNRLSSVFKEGKEGRPYYLDAIVWKTQKGHTYTGSALITDGSQVSSRQYIRMPFMPKTFYIDVKEYEIGEDDWEFRVEDEFKLDKVFEHYDRFEYPQT